MSYDISIVNKNTKETLQMQTTAFIDGGTVPAEYDEVTGRLYHAPQKDAHINITYNYSKYYYEATEGDKRFAHEEEYHDEMRIEYGIRGLYGKTPAEAIPMLKDMIKKIEKSYQDEDGNWLVTERERSHFFYPDGTECKDPIYEVFFKKREDITETKEKYTVSEGDTSSYWEMTAANAIRPLRNMIHMAVELMDDENAVWDGD